MDGTEHTANLRAQIDALTERLDSLRKQLLAEDYDTSDDYYGNAQGE